jgi:Peptidase A4 family
MKWRVVGLLLLASAALLLFSESSAAAARAPGAPHLTRERLPSPKLAPALGSLAAPAHRLHRAGSGFGVLGGSVVPTLNWAGYDVTGGGFSSVTATWVQPAIQISSTSTAYHASFWVGLDGDVSTTVEQTGTSAYTQNGSASYYAWYEMYPAAEVRINDLPVNPGNVMTATVITNGPGDFTLTITNDTTGHGDTFNEHSDAAEGYSAEVIAEAPSTGGGVEYPLADFGTVSFTGCEIDGASIGSYDWNLLNMVSAGGETLATTSALGADGASFTVANGSPTPTPTPTPTTTPSPASTPPVTTVVGADASWHKLPVVLNFAATDAGGPGVRYTDYSVDGGGWTVGTSLTIPAPSNHSNDGLHTISFSSTDNAGVVEKVHTCQVKIDTLGPVCLAKNVAVRRGKTCRVDFKVHDGLSSRVTNMVTITTKSGHVKKRWSWGYGKNVAGWRSTPFTCRLPRGTYYIHVYGKDLAGNKQTVVGRGRLRVT